MTTPYSNVCIGDLGKVITGKTPSTKNDKYWNGTVPFVTPGDLQALKRISSTVRYVSEEGAQAVRNSFLPPQSVCVSCIGNIGYVGMTTTKSVSNQQINSIIVNPEVCNADYVYYLMKSLWPHFKAYEGQSTTLSILNKTQFSKIKVSLPSLQHQDKVVALLSVFDDAIEANSRINDYLAA